MSVDWSWISCHSHLSQIDSRGSDRQIQRSGVRILPCTSNPSVSQIEIKIKSAHTAHSNNTMPASCLYDMIQSQWNQLVSVITASFRSFCVHLSKTPWLPSWHCRCCCNYCGCITYTLICGWPLPYRHDRQHGVLLTHEFPCHVDILSQKSILGYTGLWVAA